MKKRAVLLSVPFVLAIAGCTPRNESVATDAAATRSDETTTPTAQPTVAEVAATAAASDATPMSTEIDLCPRGKYTIDVKTSRTPFLRGEWPKPINATFVREDETNRFNLSCPSIAIPENPPPKSNKASVSLLKVPKGEIIVVDKEGETHLFFGTPCTTNDQCSASQFCMKPMTHCEAEGVCVPTPQICTKEYDPVLGCDGKSYGNACTANAARTSVKEKSKP